MLITGDGYYTSQNRAQAQPPILTYFPNARFDAASSGFKEYTIVGVKVMYVPHIAITGAAGTMQKTYQSSYVADHTDITALNNNAITDSVVLGKSKPKSNTAVEKMTRYMKFGYYVDSQFSKRFLKTTGGANTTRMTWVGDEGETVPGIVLRGNAAFAIAEVLGEVQIRVYYKFQGKSLA